MGWTFTTANHYKLTGVVDRKACVDDLYTWDNANGSKGKVLKSMMVGTVWYGAVQVESVEGDISVIAGVCLTGSDKPHGYNFGYKDMEGSCGPCSADCPENILKLLTETDREYALAWRKRCRENLKKKKECRDKPTLRSLPLDTVIEVNKPVFKDNEMSTEKLNLQKTLIRGQVRWVNWSNRTYYRESDIKRVGYKVVCQKGSA